MQRVTLRVGSFHGFWGRKSVVGNKATAAVVVVVIVQADRQDDFFQARLRSFEVWLQFAAPARGEVAPKPLEELPVVLQILLSQVML